MNHVPELDLWRRNVGEDVILDLAQPARTPLSGLLFDHVLHRPGGELAIEMDVRRLDENELDRGASVFGSDHHSLLAEVLFREREREGDWDRLPGTGTP